MKFDDTEQAETLRNYISSTSIKPYVFLIFDYPDKINEKDGGLIEEQLKKQSYKLIRDGKNYRLFSFDLN